MESVPAREAVWRSICTKPQIWQCEDFLTSEECAAIRRLAKADLSHASLPTKCFSKFRIDLDTDPEGALASAQPKDAAVLRAVERRTWALSGVAPHEGASVVRKCHFCHKGQGGHDEMISWLRRLSYSCDGHSKCDLGNFLFCSEMILGWEHLTFQDPSCFEGNFQGEMPWAVHYTPSAAHLKLWRLQLELGSQPHHDHCTALPLPLPLGEMLLQATVQHTGQAWSRPEHTLEAAGALLARAERLAAAAACPDTAQTAATRLGLAVAAKEVTVTAMGVVNRKFREAPMSALKACCIEASILTSEILQRIAGKNFSESDLIDEEEYALIKNLKETKQQYRDAFERHSRVKMDVIQIEHVMQQCKGRLVQGFEEYYEHKFGHLVKQEAPEDEGERYDPQEMFDLAEADRLETQHPDAMARGMVRGMA
eukprot:s1044_g18.t1